MVIRHGKQTMRVLARNMVFLMKSVALGKEKFRNFLWSDSKTSKV